MRQTPRFTSAGYVTASIMGVDYPTQDVSEKGARLVIGSKHPFRLGGDYTVYLFIAEEAGSAAETAWSVMGECRWIEGEEAGFAFRSNSFVEREISQIFVEAGFEKRSEPDRGP